MSMDRPTASPPLELSTEPSSRTWFETGTLTPRCPVPSLPVEARPTRPTTYWSLTKPTRAPSMAGHSSLKSHLLKRLTTVSTTTPLTWLMHSARVRRLRCGLTIGRQLRSTASITPQRRTQFGRSSAGRTAILVKRASPSGEPHEIWPRLVAPHLIDRADLSIEHLVGFCSAGSMDETY